MKIDLSDLNDAYLSANSAGVPNGIYPAKLVEAEVKPSKSNNRQIVWDLEVTIPSTGRVVSTKKFSPLMEHSLRWVKRDLKILGITLGHINELHDALQGLKGVTIEIQIEADVDCHTIHFVNLISRPGS